MTDTTEQEFADVCGYSSARFYGMDVFNGDISGWDVSSVTDMGAM